MFLLFQSVKYQSKFSLDVNNTNREEKKLMPLTRLSIPDDEKLKLEQINDNTDLEEANNNGFNFNTEGTSR